MTDALDPSAIGFTAEQVRILEDDILKLTSRINNLVVELVATKQAFISLGNTGIQKFARDLKDLLVGGIIENLVKILRDAKGNVVGITLDFRNFSFSLKNVIKDIKEFLETGIILVAFADQIALAFENAFRGVKSFGQTIKDFFASLLITLGQVIILMGVAAVAGGILSLNARLVAAGVVAIAAGGAAIAAGVALGGGGGGGAGVSAGGGGEGKVPTFTFDQAMIDVQQSFLQATENLKDTTSDLKNVTSTFGSMSPSEVVVTGNAQLGGASRVLATDLKKGTSVSANREIALSFRGGS